MFGFFPTGQSALPAEVDGFRIGNSANPVQQRDNLTRGNESEGERRAKVVTNKSKETRMTEELRREGQMEKERKRHPRPGVRSKKRKGRVKREQETTDNPPWFGSLSSLSTHHFQMR